MARDTETLTGRLSSGHNYPGGEGTGWLLETEGEHIEIDISAVWKAAQELDGKRVKATGRITTRNYIERGAIRVFVAESVRAAR